MESKSFLFISIPLFAIILIFGYLNINQESSSNSSESISADLCKSIEYNGEDRIDLLFISSEEDAKHYTDVLLSTEPYKDKRNYFNTRVIEQEVECKDYQGKAILCNTLEVQALAKQCPNDYVIVVKEKPSNIRSSAYGNVLSINKVHEDSVLIHEFGHAFANLAEEYGGAKIPSKAKNCVSSCDKFNGEIDSCEIECSQSNYYRSIPAGVMRTLATRNYGVYNDAIITKLLEKNKPQDLIITGNPIDNSKEQCNNPLVRVEVSQTDEGITAETDNVLYQGCAPDNFGEGSLCFNGNCYQPDLFTDVQNTETNLLEGEVFDLSEENDLTFYIEQNPQDPQAEITLDNELIQIINTEQVGATACRI